VKYVTLEPKPNLLLSGTRSIKTVKDCTGVCLFLYSERQLSPAVQSVARLATLHSARTAGSVKLRCSGAAPREQSPSTRAIIGYVRIPRIALVRSACSKRRDGLRTAMLLRSRPRPKNEMIPVIATHGARLGKIVVCQSLERATDGSPSHWV
jgi:hypothetical protein